MDYIPLSSYDIPQLVYESFLDRGLLITRKLLHQGFNGKVKSLLQKFHIRQNDLVNRY